MDKRVSPVPAAVASLRARPGNQSDALWVTWDRGGGDLSGYLLSLYDPNGSQQAKQQLGSEVTQFVFSDLVPGRLYRTEVLSLSGELSNTASVVGRTGEAVGLLLNMTRGSEVRLLMFMTDHSDKIINCLALRVTD